VGSDYHSFIAVDRHWLAKAAIHSRNQSFQGRRSDVTIDSNAPKCRVADFQLDICGSLSIATRRERVFNVVE
jgi:hypothetical protein